MKLRREDLPKELVNAANWVAWRLELRKGSDKPTKVPYNLRTGRKASSTNPSDWVLFDEAVTML